MMQLPDMSCTVLICSWREKCVFNVFYNNGLFHGVNDLQIYLAIKQDQLISNNSSLNEQDADFPAALWRSPFY